MMKYHLLMDGSGDPFILGSYPTLAEVQNAKRWMQKGGFDGVAYYITTFDEREGVFVSDGEEYSPVRGPYTEEAWKRICAEIGYSPPEEN